MFFEQQLNREGEDEDQEGVRREEREMSDVHKKVNIIDNKDEITEREITEGPRISELQEVPSTGSNRNTNLCDCISWNINGLNSPIKQKKLFKYLQIQKADIIALQEVHIAQKQKYLLENKKLGNLFLALDQKKKKGIVLYIKDWIPASLIYSDKEGRTLMVEVEIRKTKTLLVVIYAPNGPQESLFQKLHNKLKELQYQELCIIGDFNAVIDKSLDYKGNNTNLEKKKKLPKVFLDLTKEFNISDVWRERNIGKKQFTYYSNCHMSWSRLDMMWMTKKLNSEILDITMEPNVLADHNMISIELYLAKEKAKGKIKTITGCHGEMGVWPPRLGAVP
uniref:exodeoxyribonuclease III n=1 Tax=Naja naja TaxID=35670 RepID=A0A8C6VK66_NAJNA